MAAVPITLNGVMYPKMKEAGAKPIPCTFVGYAWISGLAPDHGLPGDQPHPEHPIVLPPNAPPDVIWGGGNVPMPTPPIELPPPTEPPSPPEVAKPIPPGGGWGWSPNFGWIYVPGTGSPGPKK